MDMLATAEYIYIIAVTLTKFKELLKLSLLYRRRKKGVEDCGWLLEEWEKREAVHRNDGTASENL